MQETDCGYNEGSEIMSLITKEYIDGLIATVQNLYLADEIPWMIGYSGGKDSTAAVQLVWMAISKLDAAGHGRSVSETASKTVQ